MANAFLVLGPSGGGKSTAAMTLDPKKTVVICPENKPLPFPGSLKNYQAVYKGGVLDLDKSNFMPIDKVIQYNPNKRESEPGINEALVYISDNRPEIKVALIDTFTYGMVESVMREINVENYKKFNVFAQEFYDLVKNVPNFRDDLMIIITSHIKVDIDSSGTRHESFKIPSGKLTETLIVPEGLFSVVLYANSRQLENGETVWYFDTKTNGHNTCKSPMGMFPARFIPNDYRFVLNCYYSYFYGKDQPQLPESFPIKPEKSISNIE